MTKPKMHSPDLVAQNVEWVAARFPGCITESRNEKGEVVRAVDFDLLRQELSKEVVEGPQERYHLNWPGKREALFAANAAIAKTLRPCREESVDFDATRHLFIEGDNLDALKLLQETYLNSVKMIYIDPPYNTGRDFVYKDRFAEDAAGYSLRSGQRDSESGRLVANTESNGRFHSDWLSMLYPRLRLARNLLADDGVILVSVDDNEIQNLRHMCDEIFGNSGFVAQFVWETKRAARGVPPRNLLMATHEYVVCYAHDKDAVRFRGLDRDEADFANPDQDARGLWRSESMKATGKQDNYFTIKDPATGNEFHANWAFSEATVAKMIAERLVLFPADPSGTPRQKKFIDTYTNETKAAITALGWHSTEAATKALMDLFDGQKVFDFPKPMSLIGYFCEQLLLRDDLVLDFFAGSGTTAQCVYELNARDHGKRRALLVQLPEECDPTSDAAKAGYRTIAEITKERMRRVGRRVKAEAGLAADRVDNGFRVLKIDASNMKDVYYRPDEASAELLGGHVDNIKNDRTDEDLLFQVLLDWGVDLSLPVKKETISGKPVYFVDENALAACFAAGIDEALVKALAARKPLRAVFRDSGYGGDDVKINVEQIFKQLSPGTEVKTL